MIFSRFIFVVAVFFLATVCGTGLADSDVWVAALAHGTNPLDVARAMGLHYLHAMPYPVSGFPMYAFSPPPNTINRGRLTRESIETISSLFEANKNVEWHEKQHSRQQHKRPAPSMYRVNDPLFSSQWHIQDTSPIHMDVISAWNMGPSYRGRRAVVSIVDDGLQHSHQDLSSNYEASLSHDYNGGRADPTPGYGDGHGTSASGVAAAVANAACGVGVCPECRIAGVRLIAGPSTDYMEAMALNHASGDVAVYSNSWGPADDGLTMEGPGRVTLAALERNMVDGRGGKGSIYVWAGGNGAMASDDGNYDGYANSRFTIAVGAIGYDGKRSFYSEPCACLMVSAPSSGVHGKGITTTDLLGSDGYSATDCTSDFGGTSSAAPAVAGAIGLLLGHRPDLTRRDVLVLLATTSTQVGGGGGDWTPRNANGVSHSHEYGWGLINPAALLRAADRGPTGQHVVSASELMCSTGRIVVNAHLADGGNIPNTYPMDLPNLACIRASTSVPPSSSIDYVEYVEVRVWLNHQRRGDMAIQLTDPHGVVSRLASPHNDNHPGYPASTGWTFGSARHWGQTFAGSWTLSVMDGTRNGRTGTLVAYELIVRGHINPPPPQRH